MVFAWRWLRESFGSGDLHKQPLWHTAWVVLRHPARTVSRLVWIYALGMFAFSSFTAVITLYLGLDFGVDEGSIGYVFLYVGSLSVVMRSLLLGPIVRRLGETRTMRVGVGFLFAGFVAMPAADSFIAFMAVMSTVPVGMSLTFPSTTALTSRWAEPGNLGTTMGTAQAFAGMSRTLSPLIATGLFQQIGHPVPFLFSALCMVTVGLLTLGIGDASGD
jgi:MFS family permease